MQGAIAEALRVGAIMTRVLTLRLSGKLGSYT